MTSLRIVYFIFRAMVICLICFCRRSDSTAARSFYILDQIARVAGKAPRSIVELTNSECLQAALFLSYNTSE